jgi:23S rRNA (cytidine1920-2'-O)/16S rRNA (cytidine1409-2'-O)-methyltransferase
VLLVKPQFEAGPAGVGRGGVVRDPVVWRSAITGVAETARAAGLAPQRVMASPLPGPAGNVEFLFWVRRAEGPGVLDDHAVDAAVDEGLGVANAR